MSTKTTFKRIALVAVAALGLGVLSVAPSSAVVSSLTITATNGANGNTTGTVIDTATAATFTVTALTSEALDSIAVTAVLKSAPTATPGNARIYLADTASATTKISRDGGTTILQRTASGANYVANFDSNTASAGTSAAIAGYGISGDVGYKSAKFGITLETNVAHTTGDYVYTIIGNVYKGGAIQSTQVLTDITITVAALASESKVVDATKSSATLSNGATWAALAGSDSAVATSSTASSTVKAVIRVINKNSESTAVPESITVTVTGPGVVRKNGQTTQGKSITVIGTGSDDIEILSDGTAGVASIAVKTTSITYAAKQVTFFASSASAFATPSVARPVIGVGTVADVVRVTATDASGIKWAGTAYIYATSAASAAIAGSETPVACTFDAADDRIECPIEGKTVGTATFKIIDASTVATAKATSTEVSVRVSTSLAASFTMAWDKSTYAPGEKAILRVTPLDAAGLTLPTGAITNLFATGAITSNLVLTAVSTTATTNTVSPTVAAANSSSDPNNLATAGAITYIYQMPQTTGTVTATAKGGTALPAAAQVNVTASAEVVNTSVDAATDAANEATDAANAATDAALAAADAADAATAAAQDASDAVAALSATVAKLVASLKAQITSLTNLVIKIQKKVKA